MATAAPEQQQRPGADTLRHHAHYQHGKPGGSPHGGGSSFMERERAPVIRTPDRGWPSHRHCNILIVTTPSRTPSGAILDPGGFRFRGEPRWATRVPRGGDR
jgi:hypothetical protein